MKYPFYCPNCGHKEIISMAMKDYTSEGHYCSVCNTEMKREVKSLVCGMSIDKTGDFYNRTSIQERKFIMFTYFKMKRKTLLTLLKIYIYLSRMFLWKNLETLL